MTKDSSKYNGNLELESEYTDFMSKYKQNALVTFGTTFMPNEKLCELLAETFGKFQDVGFVVSLKDNEDVNSYSIVKSLLE